MNDQEQSPKDAVSTPLEPIVKKQLLSILLSGVSLYPLLPLGMYSGIRSTSFQLIFFVHLAILGVSCLQAFYYFFYLARHSTQSRLIPAVTCLLALTVIVLLDFLPITARDALIHHLAVPKWWLESGRIVPIFWHDWSFYPMLINLGFLGLMSQGWDFLCPLYHACYLLLLASLVAAYVQSRTNNLQFAFCAVAFTLGLPICVKLAGAPLVDLGLCLFTMAAFVTLVIYFESEKRLWQIVAVGISLGLALSCKYNGLLACGLFFPLILIYGQRTSSSWSAIFKLLAVSALVAGVVFLPWALKNYLWTSNPLYPLFKSYFSGPAIASNVSPLKGLNPLEQQLLLYDQSFGELLLLPLRMLFLGRDNDPKYFDGVLSPLLLLGIFSLRRSKRDPSVLFGSFFLLTYVAFALLSSGARVRYLAPVFGIGCSLSVLGLKDLLNCCSQKCSTSALNVLMGLQFIILLLYACTVLRDSHAYSYYVGKESTSEYLRARVPEYRMIEYINSEVPKTAKVYLLFTGNQFYYYQGSVFSGGHFSAAPLLQWLSRYENAEELYQELQIRKIEYVFVHTERLKDNFASVLPEKEKVIWNDFQSHHMQLIKSLGMFSLWKLHARDQVIINPGEQP